MKAALKQVPFGLHVMLDMYDCAPEALNDQHLVKQMLDELPGLLDMRKLIEPVVVFAPANDVKDPGGWSGFVIIQESHISIHTFPKRRFVTADVYSCREFDTNIAVDYFKKCFSPGDVDSMVEVRGKNYPPADID